MIIVLMGAPGSGKGTISTFLSSKHNFSHISTGDLIRNEIKSGGDLARKINEITLEGRLVPDEIINEILRKNVLEKIKQNKSIVLDGYPRNIDQAKFLEGVAKVDYVVNITVDLDIITKRIIGRRTCSKCNQIYNIYFSKPTVDNICDNDGTILSQRVDDNEETIKNRINVYKKNAAALEDYYKQKNIFYEIDGNCGSVEVEEKIENKLNLK